MVVGGGGGFSQDKKEKISVDSILDWIHFTALAEANRLCRNFGWRRTGSHREQIGVIIYHLFTICALWFMCCIEK